MANILPENGLKAARNFYALRFMLVASLVAIVCGIVVALALLPAYGMAVAARNATPEEKVTLPPSSDRTDLLRAQLLVREFESIATSTASILPLLNDIASVRPAGVVITAMNYARAEEDGEGSVVVRGVAPSRDAINAYRETLSDDARFTSVLVPIGILAGSEGGDFTLTVTGTF